MKTVVDLLVVEDETEKFTRTIYELRLRLDVDFELNVKRAADYNEALTCLERQVFDIAILDLMIPLSGTGSTDHQYTEQLVNRIIRGEFPSTPQLIGLTKYWDKAEKEGKVFEDKMIHLESFDFSDSSWADRIALKIRTLSRWSGLGGTIRPGRYRSDVVILTTKYEAEFLPIEKHIKWRDSASLAHPMLPGIKLRIGQVDFGVDETRKVILARSPEMGMACAAAVSTQLCLVFRPRVFSVLGMCCGFATGPSPSKLGDVVVVENCACWDEGKYDAGYFDAPDNFKYRPRPLPASERVRSLLSDFRDIRSIKLSQRLGKSKQHKSLLNNPRFQSVVSDCPEVKVGKILSGLSVVSDKDMISKVRARAPEAVGLEMEVYGVYSALTNLESFNIDFVGIKGVADFGHQKDGGVFDPAQPIASLHSYSVFHELMKSYFSRYG